MKYTTLVLQREGAVSLEEAKDIVGGPLMLELLRSAAWLKPTVQIHRLTLFDYRDCVTAWKRVQHEGVDALKEAAAEANR